MNARVDPTALAAAPPSNDDTRLIALCRAAIRAIDVDIDCEQLVHDGELQYEARIPPYPDLAWRYSTSQDTARYLRKVLKEKRADSTAGWQRTMRTQIAAVADWERACKAIKDELGLAKVYRQYDRAVTLSKNYVADVASISAATIKGAAWKATVSARWLAAGYSHSADEGEELVLSILSDIRLIGTGGNNNGKIRLNHRKAA